MKMTTPRLIMLRLYNITLGRINVFALILKKILIHVLIVGKKDKYVASSKFFDFNDLDS